MKCLEHSDTILIRDDTDLIVLCRVGAPTRLFYIYRPCSKTYVDTRYQAVAQQGIAVLENILAIHAASGRDIVSALSVIGKSKLIKSAIKSEENICDCDALAVFNLEEQEQDTLLKS